MNTTTTVSPETKAAVDTCKRHLESCKGRFVATMNAVPEDKLSYSPAETSKSALQIGAHTAVSNYSFVLILQQKMGTDEVPAHHMAKLEEKVKSLTTRELILAELDASCQAVSEALDALDDGSIEVDVPTPFLTMPMRFWMHVPARHIDNHASQIDYLQTIWGDMEWHYS